MIRQRAIEIPISSIILDEDIYPRKGIDHRRVGMFAENIRDGFKFDPLEVEPVPDKPGNGIINFIDMTVNQHYYCSRMHHFDANCVDPKQINDRRP
jgi:hypothetical protein